ncbi:MAG: GAF domain-containing protein [Alistipes sp.]|nr:GAF domain-containing protein [Alistipes sp.]
MAEEFKICTGSKEERYKLLFAQAEAMLRDESDEIASMANLAAMIDQTFGFWWTGFYRVLGEELVLGPFQGPVACTRIGYGRGVCGTAWREEQTIIVEDVEKFPGHIACSSLSRSEIVVPVWRDNSICAVLDIDSEHLATFDSTDREWLEKIVALLK